MSKRQPPHDQAKAVRLTWRDRAIMNHVLRYRLTTVNVVERAVLQQYSRNAVAKCINRLCESLHLLRQTLVHPLRYYILGPAGYTALGARVPRQVTLGPQALPSEYAVLLYSLCGNQQRERLLASEVRESHRWMSDQLLRAVHCQDFENNVLELVRVDLGGAVDHVARKCVADIGKRRVFAEFGPLVARGKFRLVVITGTREKSTALRRTLSAHSWPPGLQIHIPVIPQLMTLLSE
jgi:hypothetical protein